MSTVSVTFKKDYRPNTGAAGGKRSYRQMTVCACGAKFAYQPNGATPVWCPSCVQRWADRATIYDRDRKLGQLPANLIERYGLGVADA